MLLLASFLAGLSGQDIAATAPAPVYAPPVVRPYEPPSDFGRQVAEGDADASLGRARAIVGPVAVEAYQNNYERTRSRREISYAQGVETARLSQNARMGPLDGMWRATDAHGAPVLDLVLSDAGDGQAVQGGLRFARSDRAVMLESRTDAGGERVLAATDAGQSLSLRLHPDGAGWLGELVRDGRAAPVVLTRPEGWAP